MAPPLTQFLQAQFSLLPRTQEFRSQEGTGASAAHQSLSATEIPAVTFVFSSQILWKRPHRQDESG